MRQLYFFILTVLISCNSDRTSPPADATSMRLEKQDSVLYYRRNFKTDGLIINSRPDTASAIIDTLHYNDSIAIIQDTVKRFQLGDLTSYWAKVIIHDKIGYCPVIYLTRLHLPTIKEIDTNNIWGGYNIEKYLKKYLNADEYTYSKNFPDWYSQNIFVTLKGFNIETAFCFIYYLKFIDAKTPFPLYCKNYKDISYILNLLVKAKKDSKASMTYLYLEYFYAGGMSVIEFNRENSGVKIEFKNGGG
jgi:hypothetical protein